MSSRSFFICVLLFFVSSGLAQSPTGKWIRVQTDNKEFSIEMPQNTGFFRDADGYSVSRQVGNGHDNYEMRNMSILNGTEDGTLVSVEAYEANKGVIDEILRHDKYGCGKAAIVNGKNDREPVKDLTCESERGYLRRQYFASKKFVYILTAGARADQTDQIKYFLSSVDFTPNSIHDAGPDSRPFSSLTVMKVEIEEKEPEPLPKKDPTTPTANASRVSLDDKFVILVKNSASYTDAARERNTKGMIILRVTFGLNGMAKRIVVHKSLGDGLLRQAVFAAILIKCLLPIAGPDAMKPVTKTIEYTFDIY